MTGENEDVDLSEEETERGAPVEGQTAEAEPPKAEEPPEPQWSKEEADEARLFGWKAPSEWEGEKPKGYIDNPNDFLGRVKRSSIFREMQSRVEQAEQSSTDSARKLEEMSRKALERQQKDFDRQIDSIRSQQRQAAEVGDVEAYNRLDKERGDLDKRRLEVASERSDPAPKVDPSVSGYMNSDDGAWLRNPVLFNTARQLIDGNQVMRMQPASEQIKYAESEIRKMYPAYFPKEEPKVQVKARTHSVVDAGGLAGPGRAASGGAFAKLPSDAKTQFKSFVDQGVFKDTKEDREEYATEYNAA